LLPFCHQRREIKTCATPIKQLLAARSDSELVVRASGPDRTSSTRLRPKPLIAIEEVHSHPATNAQLSIYQARRGSAYRCIGVIADDSRLYSARWLEIRLGSDFLIL